MTVLYTCGNTNLKTVHLVASAVKMLLAETGRQVVSHVVLFLSPETSKPELFGAQSAIYEDVFGALSLSKYPLGGDGLARVDDIPRAFATSAPKLVDITNGQKSTTAQLYLAASLLKLDDIYYALLRVDAAKLPDQPIKGQHYEYKHLPPFTGIADLSRLTYLDLVFYLEELDLVFDGVTSDSALSEFKGHLRQAIVSFFDKGDLRSIVSDATTSTEVVIRELLAFLLDYPPAVEFSRAFNLQPGAQQDPLGASSYFSTCLPGAG